MRVSAINQISNRIFPNRNNPSFTKPNLTMGFDKVSFSSSKSPEQTKYNKEARSLSKKAYTIFAQGKKVKDTTAQIYLDDSFGYVKKSKRIKSKAQRAWAKITQQIEYVTQNNIKAMSDPERNVETYISSNNSKSAIYITEYQNNRVIRKITRLNKETTMLDYSDPSNKIKMIFDTKTGELKQYDMNYSPLGTASASYLFEKGKLKAYNRSPVYTEDSNHYTAKAHLEFDENEKLKKAVRLLKKARNSSTADSEYYYSDGKLEQYYRDVKDMPEGRSFAEAYFLDENRAKYVKNQKTNPDLTQTKDLVLYYIDGKIQKAMTDVCTIAPFDTAQKVFTYNDKEIPQYCYLSYQIQDGGEQFDKTIKLN